MTEDENRVEVAGTTSIKLARRRVFLEPGQPGLVTMTVYVGQKPITVILPIRNLRDALDEVERR
jgi:hypothetical protein